MKNIVLTGYMGTGKTTVGILLSKETGFSFLDIDDFIVKTTGKSIKEIFATEGEFAFRNLESQCIAQAAKASKAVIATGGGAVLRSENINTLRQNGIVFNLTACADTILRNTALSQDRPLINNSSKEEIISRFEARKPFYSNCDYQINIDGKNPMQVASEILLLYKTKDDSQKGNK